MTTVIDPFSGRKIDVAAPDAGATVAVKDPFSGRIVAVQKAPSAKAAPTASPKPSAPYGTVSMQDVLLEGYPADADHQTAMTGAFLRGMTAHALGAVPDAPEALWNTAGLIGRHLPGGLSVDLPEAPYPVTSFLDEVLPGRGVARKYGAARSAGEILGDVLSPAADLKAAKVAKDALSSLGKIPSALGDYAARATGTTARKAAESLRSSEAARAAETANTKEIEASAIKRAHDRAMRSAAFNDERRRVLEDLRSRFRATEKSHMEAGASAEQARALTAQAEARMQEAEQAAEKLDHEFLAKPRATAEEFGAKLRESTKAIYDKYASAREKQSGFKEAVESAGDHLRVNTAPIREMIDTQLKGIRNPPLLRTLNHVKELLQTEGEDGLSIRSADSLRGYLDSIIQSRMVGGEKVDRETVHFLKKVKNALVKSATESWQPYREALIKWRALSRPLDVVERKGALRHVIDTDPVSTEYRITEAQVVGQVIQAARNGNPVLTRLIAESPELKDAARLYFTEDLFGKDAVPSIASLRTWLTRNETPLKQLGLYDEFRDMRTARETAARAVADAKDARDVSASEARAADAREREIKEHLSKHARLREKEKGRISDEIQRLDRQGKDAQANIERARDVADRYRQFETEINAAPDNRVTAPARAFVQRMRDDRLIDDAKYGDLLKKINAVEEEFAKSRATRQEAVTKLKRIAATAVLLGAGWVGYHAARIVF